MGLGAYPGTDPLWLGMLGMHDTYRANMVTTDVIKPQYVIEQLYELTQGKAIITTEVGNEGNALYI